MDFSAICQKMSVILYLISNFKVSKKKKKKTKIQYKKN